MIYKIVFFYLTLRNFILAIKKGGSFYELPPSGIIYMNMLNSINCALIAAQFITQSRSFS